MALEVQLREVLSAQILADHREHIEDFLLQEGVVRNVADLGATTVTERQIKELLAELADNLE